MKLDLLGRPSDQLIGISSAPIRSEMITSVYSEKLVSIGQVLLSASRIIIKRYPPKSLSGENYRAIISMSAAELPLALCSNTQMPQGQLSGALELSS
jgi:hypothetical protein